MPSIIFLKKINEKLKSCSRGNPPLLTNFIIEELKCTDFIIWLKCHVIYISKYKMDKGCGWRYFMNFFIFLK